MVKVIPYLMIFCMLITNACAGRDSSYVRKHWSYPTDEDKDCQNTRAEILIDRSLKPVTYRNSKSCTVALGEWQDFYYPELITEASKTQIDHLVPLKNAFLSGGAQWTRAQMKEFANDPLNLVITSSKTNQQKGAKDLTQWLPLDRKLACRYSLRWMEVKIKYHLKITADERNAVQLQDCP